MGKVTIIVENDSVPTDTLYIQVKDCIGNMIAYLEEKNNTDEFDGVYEVPSDEE